MEEKKKLDVITWVKNHKFAVAGTTLAGIGIAGAYYLGRKCGIDMNLMDAINMSMNDRTKKGLELNVADFVGTITNPIDSSVANYEIWKNGRLAIVNGINDKTVEYVAGAVKDIMATTVGANGEGNLIVEFPTKN